jgi:4-amino-4-deoxy-L-arabinose transferase-like glycosyltransferase
MAPDAASRRTAYTERTFLLLLIAAAVLNFFWNAWALPLFDLDEGAFTEATREMLVSHNFWTTTLDGAPRYDKPILIYWLQAASALGLGFNEFALRLPSMLAALAWMLATWRFAREQLRTDDAGAPMFAAASLALALLPGIIAHAAIADALLNLWLALAFFDMWRVLEDGRTELRWRVYLWMGLGMLTKGPVAILLPGLVSLIHCLRYAKMRDWIKAVTDWRGYLVLVAVVAPWAIGVSLQDGGAFLKAFVMEHNVGRFESAAEGHRGAWWYYLAVLPAMVLPFTALLPAAIKRMARPEDRLDAYLGTWFVVVLVLVSLAATKLPHYLLYGATPLFLLFARTRTWPHRVLLLAPPLLFLGALAALPSLLPMFLARERHAQVAGVIERAIHLVGPGYLVVMGLAAAVVVGAMLLRNASPRAALLKAAFAQAAALWVAFAPLLGAAQQGPLKIAAGMAGEHVVAWRTFYPSFSVYRDAITPQGLPQPGEQVLVRRDRVDDLRRELPDARLGVLYEEGPIALLQRAEP